MEGLTIIIGGALSFSATLLVGFSDKYAWLQKLYIYLFNHADWVLYRRLLKQDTFDMIECCSDEFLEIKRPAILFNKQRFIDGVINTNGIVCCDELGELLVWSVLTEEIFNNFLRKHGK